MVDKIKSIMVRGRCFLSDTTLALFPNSNDRISVIYGKNGSGKSTIAMGISNLVLGSPDPDITIRLLDDSGDQLNPDEYKSNIFVFNEQYIDRNVKIDDDGLGTIILLGGQVDLQADIDKHIIAEAQRKKEWERLREKLNEYQEKSNPLSPEYHLDKIRALLKRPGGWSETDSKIKGNKHNSAVKDDILYEICMLKPTSSIDKLKSIYDEKKELLDKISDDAISFPPLRCSQVYMEENYEDKVCDLLSTIIKRAVLTEREKLILSTIQNGQQGMVESSKKTFDNDSTTYCPYCYQPVNLQYKKDLLISINRVLNKEVESHKVELASIQFPTFEEDYSKYEGLDSALVKQIYDQKEKCLKLICDYQKSIEQKIGNTYTPILIGTNGLYQAIASFNILLKKLEDKIFEFNSAITKRKKLITDLVAINKEIAHFDVRDLYCSYIRQTKAKKAQEEKVEKAYGDYLFESRLLGDLLLQKSNTRLAISNINNALEYVFFSKERLSIELRNDKYYLKSNGKDVLPKNVSLGERNIIALCYFFTQMMANQEVSKLYQNETFIVIDDPVSSFDFENRVGILSYIRYQVDCLVKGNQQSKILILTHDLTTAFDLRKAMEEVSSSTKGIAQLHKTTSILQELKGSQLFTFRKERSEYAQMLQTIYQYANDEISDCDVIIGNIMRRTLEAFSTFNYRKSIEDVSCDKNVLSVLGNRSVYFNNLMYRLVLHGESHYEERVYSLRDDTNFYRFVSDNEKKRTAKDILCFMYLLNPAHVQSYLRVIKNANQNITMWCAQIKDNTSFSLDVIETSPKYKIKLFDCPLSAGIGNAIEDNVQYNDYYTEHQDCDFALKISGDSMEPEIVDNSIVLIKACENIENGQIGAFYYDGEVYCKRLVSKQGIFYLESVNTKYEPIIIHSDRVFKIYGKVIGVEKS